MHVIDVPITFRERGVKEKGILGETKSILWDLFEHQKNNHICWIYQSGLIDASPFLLYVCVCLCFLVWAGLLSGFHYDMYKYHLGNVLWSLPLLIAEKGREMEKKTDILFGLAQARYDLQSHTQPKWETLGDILLEQNSREDGNYWLICS